MKPTSAQAFIFRGSGTVLGSRWPLNVALHTGPTAVTGLTVNQGQTPIVGTVPVTFRVDKPDAVTVAYLVVDGEIVGTVFNPSHSGGTYSLKWDADSVAVGRHTIAVYVGGLRCEQTGLFAGKETAATTGGGLAASFDGVNQFLSHTDNAALSFGAGVAGTICCWVNLAAKAGDMGLVAKWTAGSTEYQVKYNSITDAYNFRVTGTNSTDQSVSTPLASAGAIGDWHFLAAQARAGTDIRIAMDGGAWSVQAHTFDIIDSNSAFCLGRNNQATPQYLAGLLDSVGVWKVQLSDADITAVYNADLGLAYADLATLGLTAGLVDWYDLDDESGAVTWVAAHGGNHLTNNGGVTSATGKR